VVITVARKPYPIGQGSLEGVLDLHTGALNILDSRVPCADGKYLETIGVKTGKNKVYGVYSGIGYLQPLQSEGQKAGRYPMNVIVGFESDELIIFKRIDVV
jgi:hypothetical protein